jgi:V8-like Glu-specific endopeptidase
MHHSLYLALLLTNLCLVGGAMALELEPNAPNLASNRQPNFSSMVQFRRYLPIQDVNGKTLSHYLADGCSATKVGNFKFITAAHCVMSFIQIYPGERHVLRSSRGDLQITIKSFDSHPNFQRYSEKDYTFTENFDYDIAVVTINQSTPRVPIAKVAYGTPSIGQDIYVGGYGKNSSGEGRLTMDIRKVDRVENNTFSFKSHIRGKFRSALTNGDSGGGVYINYNGQQYVIGVNSSLSIDKFLFWNLKQNNVNRTQSNFCGFNREDIYEWIAKELRN